MTQKKWFHLSKQIVSVPKTRLVSQADTLESEIHLALLAFHLLVTKAAHYNPINVLANIVSN